MWEVKLVLTVGGIIKKSQLFSSKSLTIFGLKFEQGHSQKFFEGVAANLGRFSYFFSKTLAKSRNFVVERKISSICQGVSTREESQKIPAFPDMQPQNPDIV
jgi:hypothetical protein